MKLKIFVRLFYLFQFFFDFIFIYAVEKLYFLDLGLSLSQIGLLLFMWSLMTLILEVPTGTLADHWSRRKMLILSGIFFALCYAIWVIGGTFWTILIGFFFRTLGSTFASGTLQAYIYDYLKLNHKEEDFEKIWGMGNAFRTFGIGIAVLSGGFLSEISYQFTSIASAFSVLTISFIAFAWPEIPRTTSSKEEKYWIFVKRSFQIVRKNANILRIVIFSGITLSIFASLEEFNDVYLQFLGFPNYVIGILFAIATIGQSLASLLAHKFKNYSLQTLNLVTIFGCIALLGTATIRLPIMAITVLFLGVLLEFSHVLNEGIIQREVPQDKRATIASLNNFVHNLIPFQLLFGLVANNYHLQLSYGIFALALFIYLLSTVTISRYKSVNRYSNQ